MSASQYELLKCDDCGKTLGYVYVSVKTWPPQTLLRLSTGWRQKIEKTAFCEECFLRRKAEMTKHK